MALPSFPGCDRGGNASFACAGRTEMRTASLGSAPEGLKPARVSSLEDWSISTAVCLQFAPRKNKEVAPSGRNRFARSRRRASQSKSDHLRSRWQTTHAVDMAGANRLATGQRTLKRAKPYCAWTGFTEAKIGHFLGSAARQRLLAIAAGFDLSGAPIEKWSSSTSLVRRRPAVRVRPWAPNSIGPLGPECSPNS